MLHGTSVVRNLDAVKEELIIVMKKKNKFVEKSGLQISEDSASSALQMLEQVRVIRGFTLCIKLNALLFPSLNKINLLNLSQMALCFGLADPV